MTAKTRKEASHAHSSHIKEPKILYYHIVIVVG